jgi:hypothetical protein
LRDDRGLEQVGAELGEDPALRDLVQRVACASDALQPARDRLRRLDLHDEVDGAHVDAELERRGRDEARNAPRLQVFLDLHALLAGDRAVVRPRDLLLGELVQSQREPLREPAVVHEDDRRAVLADELEQRRVDRRPDRGSSGLGRRVGRRRRSELAHVLDGDDDLQVELLRDPGVDQLDRSAARDEAADLLQRALRRREADPLERGRRQPLEPLERERHVGAPLRARDRVHFVEDQGVDGAQQLVRLRGEHQEERLGSRDQDVRRLAQHRLALLLRRVAGSHGDTKLRLEAGERPAEVPLDVVVQGLQRRDIEDAQPGGRRGREPVDGVEKGGERLAGARRRLDQRVRAGRDDRPAQRLRRRRRLERPLEPPSRRLRKDVERVHTTSVLPPDRVRPWSSTRLSGARIRIASGSA